MFFKDPFKESCRYRNFHAAEFNKAFNKQKELYGTSNEPQVGLKIRPMPSLLWFIIYESSLQIEPPLRLKIAAFRSNQNIHVKWRISTNKQHLRRIWMYQLSYHGIISDRDPRTRDGRQRPETHYMDASPEWCADQAVRRALISGTNGTHRTLLILLNSKLSLEDFKVKLFINQILLVLEMFKTSDD